MASFLIFHALVGPSPLSFSGIAQPTYTSGDFEAGSYNVSVYMENDQRGSNSRYDGRPWPRGTMAGLTVTYDGSSDDHDYHLLSKDSQGVVHNLQYYPRIGTFE